MINRIRDVRLQRGLTLAQVAARCTPPTTAQTVGRLETGTRTLSLGWLNRIAAALEVEPAALVRTGEAPAAQVVATLRCDGAEPLATPREAVKPMPALASAPLLVIEVEAGHGDYRPGDRIWLRPLTDDEPSDAMGRDVLVPLPAGRFVFGRLVARDGGGITVLPPGARAQPTTVASPAWLAVAEMLERTL